MRHVTALLLCTVFLPLLAAQDSTGAPLVIRTNSVNVTTSMLMSFGSETPVPTSAEGSHFVLTMDDGGMLSARTATGDSPFLTLTARPGALVDIFADKVDEAEQMGQMFGGMMGMQAGISAADVSQMIDGVFAFPAQIDLVELHLARDPRVDSKLNARLQVTPRSGSWLSTLIASLDLNPGGLLSILDPKALVTFESNISFAKLSAALRPLLEFSAKMTAKPGEDRKKAEQYTIDSFDASDGTFSMNFNPGQGGMVSLIGLRDAELSKKMLYGGASAELYEIMQRKNRMIEYEVEQNSFEHRNVKVMKVAQFADGMGGMGSNPFADADGSMTSLFAVTGSTMLMANAGADAGEMKDLIDSVTDQNLKRKSLGDNTLSVLNIRLAELAGFFGQMTGQNVGADIDLPRTVSAVLKKVGGSLLLEITSK